MERDCVVFFPQQKQFYIIRLFEKIFVVVINRFFL